MKTIYHEECEVIGEDGAAKDEVGEDAVPSKVVFVGERVSKCACDKAEDWRGGWGEAGA